MPLFDSAGYSPAELEARLRLHRLPEIGPKRFHTLIDASAAHLLRSVRPPVRGAHCAFLQPAPTLGAALKYGTAQALHCAG